MQRAGDSATRCWLVNHGVVRFFYLNEQGTERNRSFHGPGSWVGGSLPPLVVPSPYAIEALSQVDAVELDYGTLKAMADSPSAPRRGSCAGDGPRIHPAGAP
ncbi:MAG: cyclic nucleotide-binding domain-containing protein [Acidovorax sp.]|nr:cyclic nucleotide-binding domain-containing protein [Acidovorax sp.]